MVFRNLICSILIAFSCSFIFGQGDSLCFDKNKWIEFIETAFEANETSSDYIPTIENLEHLSKYPVNINKASENELRETGVFTDKEIILIMDHRAKFGGFVEKEELISIPDIKSERANFLLNFVEVIDAGYSPKFSVKQGNHLLIFRNNTVLEELQDFKNDRFFGSQWQHYFRYNYKLGKKFGIGFTVERDPGEPFYQDINTPKLSSPLAGFDFFSSHLYYRPSKSIIKSIHLGDYSLTFGQGLILWNDFATRKTAYAVSVKRSSPEVTSYRSVNEYNYLRGGAIRLGSPKLNGVVFYSNKTRDANFTLDSLSNDGFTNTLQISGLHRSSSEIESKNAIKERIYGGRLSYQKRNFHMGLVYSNIEYSNALLQNSEIYNVFDFSGTTLQNASIDYKLIGDKVEVYGENAVNDDGQHAHLNGFQFDVSEELIFSFLHRYYSKGYFSPYSDAFGESSTTNENGLYAGMSLVLSSKVNLLAYYDLYKFPWSSFSSITPVEGSDYLVQLNYKTSEIINMYVRVKDEKKESNGSSIGTGLKESIVERTTRFRYHINYDPVWFLKFKTRIEQSRFEGQDGIMYGRMIYQDLQYKFPFFRGGLKNRYPLSFTTRLAFIDVEDFGARIFAYENDVLYSYSIRGYSIEGSRFYCMLKYNFSKQLRVWVRYARFTTINGKENVINSTGQNQQSDIRVQLMYNF